MEIVTIARRRLDWAERYGGGTQGGERALAAWQDGMLNESAIGDAAAWSDRDFVRSGLAASGPDRTRAGGQNPEKRQRRCGHVACLARGTVDAGRDANTKGRGRDPAA